jgi:hypothetical protein
LSCAQASSVGVRVAGAPRSRSTRLRRSEHGLPMFFFQRRRSACRREPRKSGGAAEHRPAHPARHGCLARGFAVGVRAPSRPRRSRPDVGLLVARPVDLDQERLGRPVGCRGLFDRMAERSDLLLCGRPQAKQAGWKAFREILKFCAKQQGWLVRCVPASPPGSVGRRLPATFRLPLSEMFPVPALLRCQCIRNSIDGEQAWAGQ